MSGWVVGGQMMDGRTDRWADGCGHRCTCTHLHTCIHVCTRVCTHTHTGLQREACAQPACLPLERGCCLNHLASN